MRLFHIIKQQIKKNVSDASFSPSKVMLSLLVIRIKKRWVITHNLMNLRWNKFILRNDYLWTPADEGWFKCNFDGYSKGDLGLSRARCILRNTRAHLIEGYCMNLGRGSNNRAEAIAAWKGLR